MLLMVLTSDESSGNQNTATLTAYLPSSGAVTKQTQRQLSGAFASSGSSNNLTSRTLSAALSSTGGIFKGIFRLLAATQASAGLLSASFIGGIQAIAFSAVVSFSGSANKLASKYLAANFTASGLLTRLHVIIVGLVASLSLGGSFSKSVAKRLGAILGSISSLVNRSALRPPISNVYITLPIESTLFVEFSISTRVNVVFASPNPVVFLSTPITTTMSTVFTRPQ